MLMQATTSPASGGFDNLNLIGPIRRAVREEKYSLQTPIQIQAIPHLLSRFLRCLKTHGLRKKPAEKTPAGHIFEEFFIWVQRS